MQITIDLGDSRTLHLSNDGFDNLNYIELWIEKEDTLETESITIPTLELFHAAECFNNFRISDKKNND